jgi:hypothetical protein
MLKFSFEFACLPFVEHDISTVIWILEFYDVDSELQQVIPKWKKLNP